MKNIRSIHILMSAIILVFSACAPQKTASPVTYKTISAGTLKPGSAIPAPTNDVILTVTGNITQKNVEDTLQFDMATLESIGVIEYRVDDPYLKKSIVYSGVLLSELLKVIGADKNATTIKFSALDDYSTEIKVADINKWPIIIASKADGAYIPLDQKGPLISVFPFNDFPEIDHLKYDSQWAWSLAKMTVK